MSILSVIFIEVQTDIPAMLLPFFFLLLTLFLLMSLFNQIRDNRII